MSGTISVAGSASDDVSLVKVEVSVDGGAFAAAHGTSPWSYSLDTTVLANGSNTVTARASDGSGKTSSATVTFTVTTATGGSQMVTPAP